MLRLVGIPNCDTVKKARFWLESQGISYDFIDLKKFPPTPHDLKRWAKAYGDLPINKSGTTYRKNKEQFETLSQKEKVLFIISTTSMIKRPILETDTGVIAFGFDEPSYEALLPELSKVRP